IPHYLWRIAAYRSMESLRSGALSEHLAHRSRARALAERASDPNAVRCLARQSVARLRVTGRFEEAIEAIEALRPYFLGTSFGPFLTPALKASVLASLGRLDEARVQLDAATRDAPFVLKDLSL